MGIMIPFFLAFNLTTLTLWPQAANGQDFLEGEIQTTEKLDPEITEESFGGSVPKIKIDSKTKPFIKPDALSVRGKPNKEDFDNLNPINMIDSGTKLILIQGKPIPSPETKNQIQIARDLLNKGRYEDAIAPLKKALKKNPDLADVHFPLGLAYAGLGRHQKKISHYRETIRIMPNHGPAHFKLGLHEAAQNRHQEAINHYKNALKVNPEADRVHYFLGLSLYLSKRYQEALVSFKNTLEMNPSQPEANYSLGLAYIKLGKYKKAVKPLKNALSLRPNLLDTSKKPNLETTNRKK